MTHKELRIEVSHIPLEEIAQALQLHPIRTDPLEALPSTDISRNRLTVVQHKASDDERHPDDGLLVDATGAARMCGIGRTLWLQKRQSGRVPAPIKIGRRTLWSRAELVAWIEAGAPPPAQWKQIKEINGRKRK